MFGCSLYEVKVNNVILANELSNIFYVWLHNKNKIIDSAFSCVWALKLTWYREKFKNQKNEFRVDPRSWHCPLYHTKKMLLRQME